MEVKNVKTLISVAEIKSLANTGKKILYVEPGTLVTPAAKDAAVEFKIEIITGYAPQEIEEQCCETKVEEKIPEWCKNSAASPELISQIVMEVMANLPQMCPREMVKELDPSGVSPGQMGYRKM